MAGKIAAQYIGPGYYAGIPMRDLDVDDWYKLSPAQQEMVKTSSIYHYMPGKNEKPAKGGARKPAKKN